MTSLQKYWNYLKWWCPDRPLHLPQLETDLAGTDADEPSSALEFNNFAVLAFVDAEQSESDELRMMTLELALTALNAGVALDEHPLCMVHLAIARSLLEERHEAAEAAIEHIAGICLAIEAMPQRVPLGLVYIPSLWRNGAIARCESLQHLLTATDGNQQALLLCAELLYQIQRVFYNGSGLRFLQLAVQLAPQSVFLNLKLGLASLLQRRPEGVVYLHRAVTLAPECSPALQALYLAYRHPQEPEAGNFWLETGRTRAKLDPDSLAWQWTELPLECPFSYLPFEDFPLAVEPTIQSVVTAVLLAEGDWFEAEMEFWRTQIQPGMTVIDVGANVGVYSFSAARRTGAAGRVLAVEPSLACVQCLQATADRNGFSWVTVCAGAASDRNGRLSFQVHRLSVLNQVVNEEGEVTGQRETVACFTLDHLVEQERVERVDWLKLDAEGHELQVLQGSDRLLQQWRPKILYENLSGADSNSEGGNRAVAEFLIARGYQLFRYHPYFQQLVPINSTERLADSLNLIAVPGE